MGSKSIFIVDDERNIRLTLSQCLEPLGFDIETAETGREALARLREKEFGVVLLDLRMPGMDGMEVLRMIQEMRPDIQVIIITAHGTIDLAVEAMKLGAVYVMEKPFVPEQVREMVLRVMDRERAEERKGADYAAAIDLAKRSLGDRQFDAAFEHLRRAMYIDHGRPEVFNLMGAVRELRRDFVEARKYYRAALSIDPTFEPAMKNLERVTSWHKKGSIVFGEVQAKGKREARDTV